MTARHFDHALDPRRLPRLGLVVLQADETIELDFRRLVPAGTELLVTRVPSGDEVTPETLAAMEHHLGAAAALLPRSQPFDCLAYACTSGAAQISPGRTAAILGDAVPLRAASDPVTALTAACHALGIRRLGLLSPYTSEVSDRLRAVLSAAGIDTPVFGSFNVAEEARVVRIDHASIARAATTLAATGGIDALFLSCTNLRTLDLIGDLEHTTGLPVLSSNQVLAWHMLGHAGLSAPDAAPGRLFRAAPLASAFGDQ